MMPLRLGYSILAHSYRTTYSSICSEHARTGVVAVKTGPNGTECHIHKTLLTEHSQYFDRALNGAFKETEEGIIILNDVNSNTRASTSITIEATRLMFV